MAVVKKCCCCCQLRTGVTVLGWIGMVLGLLHLTSVSVIYANLQDIVWNVNFGDPGTTQRVLSVLGAGLPIEITGAVVSVVSCILLIWGASVGNRFMLLPWLILEMISIVLVGLVILIGGIVCFSTTNIEMGFVVLVFGGLFIAIEVYIWICVLSCFQELRDSQTLEENTLLEIPKSFENIIVDYRPPEYERLATVPNVD